MACDEVHHPKQKKKKNHRQGAELKVNGHNQMSIVNQSRDGGALTQPALIISTHCYCNAKVSTPNRAKSSEPRRPICHLP
jgi:hypothetical protein